MLKIKLILKIVLVFAFCSVNGQKENVQMNNEIDSTFSLYKNNSSHKAFLSHHKNLKKSIQLSYTKGVLESYNSLMWYHGYLNKESYGLDSIMFYSYLFEDKISKLDTKNYSYVIGNYFINKGTILGEIFELTEESLSNYLKAYPYLSKEDKKTIALYNISLSRIYIGKNEYDKALKILLKSIKDSTQMSSKHKRITMGDIANCYSYSGKHQESLEMNLTILKEEQKSNDLNGFWWTKNEICRNYFNLGMPQKAIDSALVAREELKKLNHLRGVDNNADLLSEIYNDIDVNISINYLEDALAGNELLYTYSDFFADQFIRLASLYERKNDIKTALKLYKKSNVIHDSITSRKKKLLITYTDLSTKYFTEKELNESITDKNNFLKKKNKEQQLSIFIITVCFFVLLLIFFVVFFYRKYKEGKREVKKLKINEKVLLEEQIKLRDNELAATIIGFSKRLCTLNHIKEELEGSLLTDQEKVEKTSKTITELIDSASEIATITEKISSKYPSLTMLLREKHPFLTDREIDYCLLTKLNLSIKETASILNVSPATVKVARSKLKLKMNIPAAISFKEYLNQICTSLKE